MGFFNKIFGGGDSGSKLSEVMKEWKTYEDKEKGFLFSYPPGWSIEKTEQGIEMHPPDATRVMDPAQKREAADPQGIVRTGNVADSGQNILKDIIRSRSEEYPGYKFVKHHSNSISKAVHGVIYEIQYGPQDQPFCALSAIAQSKDRFVDMTISGTLQSFDRNRSVIEGIVFSFRLS